MIWWENTTGAVRPTQNLARFALLPGKPHLMAMSTYWRVRESGRSEGRKLNDSGILGAMSAAIKPVSRASVGLGIEFGARATNTSGLSPRQEFGWNATSLRAMLADVARSGISEVSIYTNPEGNQGVPTKYGTHGSWSRDVAPWYVEEISRFVGASAHVGSTTFLSGEK